MKKTVFFLLMLFSPVIFVHAQDHIYSQFFNQPVYLNPALNGQFDGDLRVNMVYRNQWTSIAGDISFLSASVDYQIPQFGGGVGLLFTRSNEGTAYLKKNNLAGVYSYSVGTDDFIVSFGAQAGITNRSLDWGKLVFTDQIDDRLGYMRGTPTNAEMPSYNNRMFFDAAAGINVVFRDLMLGGALYHINKPDESFTGMKAQLPMRTTLHASYRYALNRMDPDATDGSYLIPSVVYYNQAGFTSVSGGMQFKHHGVNAGLWYRTNSAGGGDAVVLSFIFDLFINRDGGEKLRFGFSHDATTSNLNYMNTSGTTEGSIGYETTLPNRGGYGSPKFEGNRRCYDFY
ncbi:MAG: PorP/SprF family type IX secretion system membrane protein [Mucilaginibacter polytrichastri]|nr:PorP/SprF family type IX secretion system membrane protein [Mucilaginibacter polytrichastri]